VEVGVGIEAGAEVGVAVGMGVGVGLGSGVAVGNGVAVGVGVEVGSGGSVGEAASTIVEIAEGAKVDEDVTVLTGSAPPHPARHKSAIQVTAAARNIASSSSPLDLEPLLA